MTENIQKKSRFKKWLILGGISCIVLIFILLICTITSLVMASAIPLKGSGNVTTEEYTAKNFNKIKLNGKGNIIFTQDSDEGVKIEAEDNIIEALNVKVSNKTLVIETKRDFPYFFGRNLANTKDINIYISSKTLEKIELNGDADFTCDKLTGDNLDISLNGSADFEGKKFNLKELNLDINGSANIELSGQVKDQTIDISGFGSIKAKDFESTNSTVVISGSGDIEVYADKKLNVTISGSGTVLYYGNPSDIKQKISGAGEVKKGE